MKMSSASLVTVVLAVSLCQTSAFFPSFYRPATSIQSTPRCPVASKPCRIRAELDGPLPDVITSEPCSCPDPKSCSNDWEANRDRVIVRELVTDSNINITLKMMFCVPVQPPSPCGSGEVAVQLAGYSPLPTEVDLISCTCTDTRPLVIHEKWMGSDHRNYNSYVCANSKRRCNIGWRRRDFCLTNDVVNHRTQYPCKCPWLTTCRALPYSQEFTCRRGRQSRSG